nr:hypothetical protein [Tanacetum cinerariifolium]
MANENVPAPAPTRSDDQMLSFDAWVPIGKRNFILDLQKKSPINLVEDDLSLGNLKFVPKGEIDEVFEMKIPEELITDNREIHPTTMPIWKWLQSMNEELLLRKKVISQPSLLPYKRPTKGKVIKAQTVKSSLQLIEPNEEQDQPEGVPEPQGACEEYDLERAIRMSLESFQAHGQAHVGSVAIQEPVAKVTRPLLVVKGMEKAMATEEQAAQLLLDLHTPKRRTKSYKDPEENNLLRKTRDMGSFIKWFCKRIGKKKLRKSSLEGPTFKVGHRLVSDVSKPLPLGGPPDFLFKEYYTIISKLRVVIYRDRNDQKKMLRENEVHKFSDGTLTRVLHKLDHMIKDFMLYQYNSGMEYKIWFEDDKRGNEEFIGVVEIRLKIWRIFQSLESFLGG